MKVWVGVTDKNWFEFLRARAPDEVNFWQPSVKRRAADLEAGAPFLFKLHAPHDFIVGRSCVSRSALASTSSSTTAASTTSTTGSRCR
jgi:putative restriction endonuclease